MEQLEKNESQKSKSLMQKFKLFLKSLIEKPIIFWLLAGSFFFNGLIWLIILIFIRGIDGGIILHYNVYFGVDETGARQEALILPIIGIIFLFLNSFLASYLYKRKERIAAYILLMASLAGQINILIATLSIALINY